MDYSTRHDLRRITEYWRTRDGQSIRWADLETRHLWNIARMLVRQCRHELRLSEAPRRVFDQQWMRKRLGSAWLLYTEQDKEALRRSARGAMRRRAFEHRAKLTTAIDEINYRGALPTWDALRVAWDRACGGDGGPNVADDPEHRPWCLIELWVGFRGEPTTSAE